jgi:hypothetical protein
MSARRPIVSLSFHTHWGLRLTIAPIEGGKWQAWGPLAAGMIDKDGERLMRTVVEFATLEYLDHDATPKELADAIEEAAYPWEELRRLVRLFRGEDAERFEAAAKASPHVRSIRSDGDA